MRRCPSSKESSSILRPKKNLDKLNQKIREQFIFFLILEFHPRLAHLPGNLNISLMESIFRRKMRKKKLLRSILIK